MAFSSATARRISRAVAHEDRTAAESQQSRLTAVMNELNDDLEARAIVAVCAFAGLRRSEVQGLRWQDWDDDQLHVKQSVFNGKVNEPKSQASKSWVPVIPQLRAALAEYRAELVGQDEQGIRTEPDCRIFLYTLDHFARKKISAAFRRAKVKWEGYHGFRRGLASNLFELGASDLLVMRVLRHASVQMTRSSYIKVRDGILEAAMMEFSAKLGSHQAERDNAQPAK